MTVIVRFRFQSQISDAIYAKQMLPLTPSLSVLRPHALSNSSSDIFIRPVFRVLAGSPPVLRKDIFR
jgi:hypothetical protein